MDARGVSDTYRSLPPPLFQVAVARLANAVRIAGYAACGASRRGLGRSFIHTSQLGEHAIPSRHRNFLAEFLNRSWAVCLADGVSLTRRVAVATTGLSCCRSKLIVAKMGRRKQNKKPRHPRATGDSRPEQRVLAAKNLNATVIVLPSFLTEREMAVLQKVGSSARLLT